MPHMNPGVKGPANLNTMLRYPAHTHLHLQTHMYTCKHIYTPANTPKTHTDSTCTHVRANTHTHVRAYVLKVSHIFELHFSKHDLKSPR